MINSLPQVLGISPDKIREVCIRDACYGRHYGHIIYKDEKERLVVGSLIQPGNNRFSILEEIPVESPEVVCSFHSNIDNLETNGATVDELVRDLEKKARTYLSNLKLMKQ